MKHLKFAVAAASALALAPVGASAATIVSCGGGSNCISGTDNVLLTSATGVAVGTGQTNTAPSAQVQFTAVNELLNLNPSGQASISSTDGTLNNLSFSLLGGFSFQTAEFNLLNGAANPLSVTVSASDGSFKTFTLSNSNGTNRFGITADAGELLTGASFNSDVGFNSLTQLRIGGVSAGGTPGQSGAVPEPSTWAMMLIGFGGVGFGMRRRKGAANAKRALALA